MIKFDNELIDWAMGIAQERIRNDIELESILSKDKFLVYSQNPFTFTEFTQWVNQNVAKKDLGKTAVIMERDLFNQVLPDADNRDYLYIRGIPVVPSKRKIKLSDLL